jgi:hypothetical protein
MLGIMTLALIVTEPAINKGEEKPKVEFFQYDFSGPSTDHKRFTLFTASLNLATETWYFGEGSKNSFYISSFSFDFSFGINYNDDKFFKLPSIKTASVGLKIGNFELSAGAGMGDIFDWNFGIADFLFK